MIFYNVQTGIITRNKAVLGIGYSGHGDGVNNPLFETVRAVGPLPRGVWKMLPPYDHPRLGRYAIPLIMKSGDLYGRSGFFVHGDNKRNDRSASLGCIIAAIKTRQLMWVTDEEKLITAF